MTAKSTSFTGSVPEFYDRYMGPVFFDPYAADLVARARGDLRGRVLEIAAGTGRLTSQLLAELAPDAHLTATDLNGAMIGLAREKVPEDARLEWREADAMVLPFPDHHFDTAVCQYGVMFFPDKRAAAAEVRRVLKPGGVYWFNAWGSHADNPVPKMTHALMLDLYPVDPPGFYQVPWSYHDPKTIRTDLEAAGFHDITIIPVAIEVVAESARHVAMGMIRGTPGSAAIAERGTPTHEEVVAKLAERLAGPQADAPLRVHHLAFVARAVA